MTDNDFQVLNVGEAVVTFRKVSGEIRKMRCTRNVPIIKSESPDVKRPTVPTSLEEEVRIGHIRVVDLDKKEWRSFRVESVISVEVV